MIDLHLLEAIALTAVIVVIIRQAAGRLALRASIGPLLFLVSRWPFVAAWILGTGGWAWYLTTHLRPGAPPMPTAGVVGLSLLCGGGVAVVVVMPVWTVVRLLGPRPVLPLEEGEVLLWERLGNHFLGMESRGRKVLVTSRRLCFRPHRLNVQLDTWSLSRDDLDEVEVSGPRAREPRRRHHRPAPAHRGRAGGLRPGGGRGRGEDRLGDPACGAVRYSPEVESPS